MLLNDVHDPEGWLRGMSELEEFEEPDLRRLRKAVSSVVKEMRRKSD